MTNKSKETAPTPTPPYSLMQESPTPPPQNVSVSPNAKLVKAGLTDSTAFKAYSISIPEGWTDARENTQAAGIDKLTITKNGYSLTIYQAAMGGGGRIYQGDPPAVMAQEFTDFVDIKGSTDQFRRSWNTPNAAKTTTYTVCYKGTDNSYGTISSYGAISVVSPNPADAKIMAEVDGMIASLAKQ